MDDNKEGAATSTLERPAPAQEPNCPEGKQPVFVWKDDFSIRKACR